jgi:aminoglycoside phosphotransferase
MTLLRASDRMNPEDLKTVYQIANKNHFGEPYNVTQFSAGKINKVFNLNNQFVIKLEGDLHFAKGLFSYQSKINQALVKRGAKVSEILDYGNVDGKEYLLMKKLPGKLLSYYWPKEPDKVKKEQFIAQIAEQIKMYHSFKFDHYAVQLRRDANQKNWLHAVVKETDFLLIQPDKLKSKYRKDFEILLTYFEKYKNLLNEQDTAVFTHNDLHFGNILFESDIITGIIDFDWCAYAPKDYELRKFVDYAYAPADYAQEDLKKEYKGVMFKDELNWLKKYYPELFSGPNIYERVNIYFYKSFFTCYL